jgi:hypothetical protein
MPLVLKKQIDVDLTLVGICLLSWVAVNLASSTEMIAASSQGRIRKPKIHHQY